MEAIQFNEVNPGQELVIFHNNCMKVCVMAEDRLCVSCADGSYIRVHPQEYVIVEQHYTKSEWRGIQE